MSPRGLVRPFSVAPMMDRTDRHFRFMFRHLSRQALLYTEMVTTPAILRGDRARHLNFDPLERPLSLQLGGDDPGSLAECARIAADWGYDEVNLNIGCPSDRVQSGCFGASLMTRPDVVARCVEAMRQAVDLPVTVKHRVGVDDLDRYEDMLNFVDVVARSGADRFSVHARKAWLKGLSPKENRTVPPLRYDDVYRLKRERPDLVVEINGGVLDLMAVQAQLEHVDAVMVGRAAYDTPFKFSAVDSRIFGGVDPGLDRAAVVSAMLPHIDHHVAGGGRVHHVTRHLLGLFNGERGARQWRRHLSTYAPRSDASVAVVAEALAMVA